MESLLINHSFVDGNKRTAFAAFLRINGKHLKMHSAVVYALIKQWVKLFPFMRLQNMIHNNIRLFMLE